MNKRLSPCLYILKVIPLLIPFTHPLVKKSEMYPAISFNLTSAWLWKTAQVTIAILHVSIGVQRVYDLP